MSFDLESGFNKALALQSREMVFHDIPNAIQVTINAAPSNYFRNLAGPEETVMSGRELVVSKKELDNKGFPTPKRGHKIIDADFGYSTITTVREMVILGKIVGYRIRSE